MRQARILAAAMLIAVAMPSYSSRGEPPLYTIASIAAPPQINGRLDDPCWQTATRIGPFVVMGSAAPPAQETRAWAAYDNRALYVAFECLEDRMADITAQRTARDSEVWKDDCVEVFLAPMRDPGRYFHLVVNSINTKYDEREALNAASWNGEWQSAATKALDRWTVEIAIPFSSLGVAAPSMLEAWGLNLAREEKPHRELSEISPTIGSFHDVARFAEFVFAGPEALTASVISTGAPFLGQHGAEVRVRNNSARPARASLWAEVPGLREARTSVELGPFDSRMVTVPYEVYAEGDLELMLSGADASGRSVLRSTAVSFRVEPNLGRVRQIQRSLDRLRDPATKRGLAIELDKANREAERLAALAQDRKRWASGNRGDWARLTALVERLDVRANRVRLRTLTSDPATGYAIGVETPLRKIRPDAPYRGAVGLPAQVWLCRNEYEPVQVAVLALDRPLARVRVSVTDLVGPGGAHIRSHHVALNLVGFVQTRKPAYAVERVGWFPDPLMEVQPFDVKADGVQPVWVTVYCPATAPAGDYAGEIMIKPDNAAETRMPLIAHVWDFALPKETHLKTAFALSEGEIAAWYGYDRVPDEVRLRYYDFLLRHRINPTNIYSATPVPAAKDMSFCISRGLNAFNIKCVGYAGSPERRRAEVEEIRRYAQFLKEQGWFEGAYIYGFDEIRRADYPKLREMYGMIREACPGLPRVCTVVPNDDLKGFVDIWVPLTAAYNHETALRYRAAGDHVWWYICCGPHHPYANWFVDYPATDPRLLFWMNWKYGTDGFLYYCLNNWASNRMVKGLPVSRIPHDDPAARAAIAAGKRWPEVPWNTFTYSNFNGDGHLIYPGPGGKPLSSIRLECIRDGIEDYEYFYLLAGLAARLEGSERYRVMVNTAKRLLSIEPEVVKSLTEYTDDPEVVERARRDLGNHIQAMSRAAGQ
jgi:hypothetical protein